MGDIEWIARALEAWSVSDRLSLDGYSVTPDRVERLLSAGVVIQRVCQASSPVGLLQLADHEPERGTAVLGVMWQPNSLDRLAPAVRSLMGSWAAASVLRHAWLMTSAEDEPLVRCLDGFAERSGRLVGHRRLSSGLLGDLVVHQVRAQGLGW